MEGLEQPPAVFSMAYALGLGRFTGLAAVLALVSQSKLVLVSAVCWAWVEGTKNGQVWSGQKGSNQMDEDLRSGTGREISSL